MGEALTKSKKSAIIRTRNNGQWTEGRFRSFVTSALRAAWRRWPPKWLVLQKSLVGRRKNKRTGREAKHYRCAICDGAFPQTQIQIDHITPIGSKDSWDLFIEALFCEKENLQAVCKECHKIKTRVERQALKEGA